MDSSDKLSRAEPTEPVPPLKARMKKWSEEHPQEAEERLATREGLRAQKKVTAKFVRLIPTVSGQFTDADLKRAVDVVREIMDATQPLVVKEGDSSDGKGNVIRGGESVEFIPDNKARLEAAKFLTAMVEGLPVARQLNIQADFRSLDEERKARMLGSGSVLEALEDLEDSGETLAT